MTTITIGTRKSKLAMWQARYVAEKLEQNDVTAEIVAIETKGDKILDRSIAKIGSKGVFTEELETQLATGQTDIAVHSAKDMQSRLPDGFRLIAFTERERSHDVLVSHDSSIAFESDPRGLQIGTSSVRRIALLHHYFPAVQPVPMRGNLQTRIAKLERGDCDALLLAYAGVRRMGYERMIVHHFPSTQFIPPVGQGCIAIEAAETLADEKMQVVRSCINDPKSEWCLVAERAYLRVLEGGCSIPAFGHATLIDDTLSLAGGLSNLDGSWLLSKTVTGHYSQGETLGKELADYILANGGREILRGIKKTQAT